MKTNLLVRFVIIICVALIAGWVAHNFPPTLGIDLAGGTQLVYELDLSKAPAGGQGDLAAQVIEVLKKRVDPLGTKNMIWRVVEGKRIEIQMPYPSQQVQDAIKARETADKNLRNILWRSSELAAETDKAAKAQPAASLPGTAPALTPAEQILKNYLDSHVDPDAAAAGDAEAHKKYQAAYQDAMGKLRDLADAAKKVMDADAKLNGIRPQDRLDKDLEERDQAHALYDKALDATRSFSVDISELNKLMARADSFADADAQTELADLPGRFPLHKGRILALIAAHKSEIKLTGGGVDSPEELQRLVTQAGVLDFRIALTGPDMTPLERQLAQDSLRDRGPDVQVQANGLPARWFEIESKSKDNFKSEGYYVKGSDRYGTDYILCYDDHEHTLTHSDPKRQPWQAGAGKPQSTNEGIYLPFNLPGIGGNYMGDLTSGSLKKPMAILLDDKAISAPTIQSQINDNGQITFGTPSSSHTKDDIEKEANYLKQIMDAGSLPATLQPEPISVEKISPDMGADNIKSGVRSAYIAVAAVVGFMLVYYTITGIFADLALMLNLLLVLASMALLRQTFTLPGIAGLVLTLGMAVDANVLINERIREEIHRGASLWMAIKQGYDKVFWTIFDANLTTSLTSIVLIFVGSEEVKGFGVTLLIGLCIHMFTALFVTRTFMQAAVRWGILKAIDDHSLAEYFKEIFTLTWLRKGHWPFMRVITVTKIDWIGMRKKFWVVSAIITLAGIVAFFARGEDKYDIEFRGGTQITFQLKDPMNNVVEKLVALSVEPDVAQAAPEIRDLEDQLKNTQDEAKHAQIIKDLVAKLDANGPLKAAHPAVARLAADLKDAQNQKTLTLDEVRAMIEDMHTLPGLGELAGARVYAVGNTADRRYTVQTTIANAPQNLEVPLPKAIAASPLARLIKVDQVTHDSTGTTVVMTPIPQADNGTAAENVLQAEFRALATQPGLGDLANTEVQSVDKPEDHGKPAHREITATIPNQNVRVRLLEPLAARFKDVLESKPQVTMANAALTDIQALRSKHVIMPIVDGKARLDQVFDKTEFQGLPKRDLTAFAKGVAIIMDDLKPAENAEQITARIATMRRSSEFAGIPNREFLVIPITVVGEDGKDTPASENDPRPMHRAVMVVADPIHGYRANDENAISQWQVNVADKEWKILTRALTIEDLFEGVTSFDAVVAAQAKIQALLAIAISLALIVIYVWVRFGGIRYGVGAILSLMHDAIVALAGTVLAGVLYTYVFNRHDFLLITDFKINLTMIAAYLTVIGYSVNDTIVIFDRVREMRGKSHIPLTPKLINDAINQCFGRTIWTTFTVFIVVMIMYIWGGQGVRGFSFAMLIGVITGAYSTLAIASPMLLTTGAGTGGPKGPSPFMRKDAVRRVPELPEESGDGAEDPESADDPEGPDESDR